MEKIFIYIYIYIYVPGFSVVFHIAIVHTKQNANTKTIFPEEPDVPLPSNAAIRNLYEYCTLLENNISFLHDF